MQSIFETQNITFLVGLALIIIAIFGGNVSFSVVQINQPLSLTARIMSSVAGAVLMLISAIVPQWIPGAPTARTSSPTQTAEKAGDEKSKIKCYLGASNLTNVISVSEVKAILKHLGKFSGSVNDDVNDAYCQAIAAFQTAQDIGVDGMVGPQTLGRLRQAWPEYFAKADKPDAGLVKKASD